MKLPHNNKKLPKRQKNLSTLSQLREFEVPLSVFFSKNKVPFPINYGALLIYLISLIDILIVWHLSRFPDALITRGEGAGIFFLFWRLAILQGKEEGYAFYR
jgi:hypothetical protein